MNSGPKLLMRESVGKAILMAPYLRRLLWRAGRSLYCLARGEQRHDDMHIDGEIRLQSLMIGLNRDNPDFIAFDIGANQGDWTAALLSEASVKLGPKGRLRAFAFEPVPSTRSRLSSRLSAGVASTLVIEPMAVSDRLGQMKMVIMTESGGTNSLVFDKDMERAAIGNVDVSLVTLDSYCADNGIKAVAIVKCDTEGHDLAVMRGSEGLLKHGCIDLFQFEYNWRWIAARAFLKDVFELIEDKPYALGRVMPESVELFERWHPELERYYQSNFVLMHTRILDRLNPRRGKFDKTNTYA
ncbi:FkbM family methyltransferase [Mesorhizobium sp. M1163]|uniref:FkbM family methyltransferase n=1 Tax=Mesorhizobium sp. M1163 TaxID=2957065 RepID=UPI00333D0B1B